MCPNLLKFVNFTFYYVSQFFLCQSTRHLFNPHVFQLEIFNSDPLNMKLWNTFLGWTLGSSDQKNKGIS